MMTRLVLLAAMELVLIEGAYECESAVKKLKNGTATNWCRREICSDTDCCERDTAKCGGDLLMTCPLGKTYTVGAAGKNANECCTVDQNKCSSLTCGEGYKAKAGKENYFCVSPKCSDTEDSACCEVKEYLNCSDVVCADIKDDGKSLFENRIGTTATYSAHLSEALKGVSCCKLNQQYCIAHMLTLSCPDGKRMKFEKEGKTVEECCVEKAVTCASFTKQDIKVSFVQRSAKAWWVFSFAVCAVQTLLHARHH
eukprot:TRINITY_DN71254_c0_g1_i1.p1 TRINITY_DN71254_c0_g1~~TRINITY_DN71254_c0_g1_i1.p1  ORF type:complete len:254 (+),score=21.41 TRINITY_DN71254_c0_g1_i1:101-862(+)